jgi:threonine dehydrogenase-like Zn-dependent dehydrogenase
MGHEFVGEVVETGSDVSDFKVGDLVMSPFTTNCGQCEYCRCGLTSRCIYGQLFGWVENKRGLNGGQAECVRVPLADRTLLQIPPTLTLEQGLLLGDVIPTGYYCAHQASIETDKVYVVIGCGAVGLMSVLGALDQGATTLYAVDTLPERLALAESFGAIPINATRQDPVKVIRAGTHGLGAHGVMEAVGNNKTLKMAYDMVRHGGIISMVGVNTEMILPISPGDIYNKNLTLKIGRCPARYFMEKLLPSVVAGKHDYSSIVTHRMDLKEGSDAYKMFANRNDHCVKIVLAC